MLSGLTNILLDVMFLSNLLCYTLSFQIVSPSIDTSAIKPLHWI